MEAKYINNLITKILTKYNTNSDSMKLAMSQKLTVLSTNLLSKLQTYHSNIYQLNEKIINSSISMVDIVYAKDNADKLLAEQKREQQIKEATKAMNVEQFTLVQKDQELVSSVASGEYGMKNLQSIENDVNSASKILVSSIGKMLKLRKSFPIGTSFHSPLQYCTLNSGKDDSTLSTFWIEPVSDANLLKNQPFQILCNSKGAMLIARISNPSFTVQNNLFISTINK